MTLDLGYPRYPERKMYYVFSKPLESYIYGKNLSRGLLHFKWR